MNIDWEYAETPDKHTPPPGERWQYWGDRVTPEDHVAVWRRERIPGQEYQPEPTQ